MSNHHISEVPEAVFAKVIRAHLPALEQSVRKRYNLDTTGADQEYQAGFVKEVEEALENFGQQYYDGAQNVPVLTRGGNHPLGARRSVLSSDRAPPPGRSRFVSATAGQSPG
jgi:hypothetical protein